MRIFSLVLVTALVLTAGSSMLNAKDGIPDTMEEAYRFLDAKVPPAQREYFKKMTETDAVATAHMGLGMHIRNYWFRSGKSALPGLLHSLGAGHLDDMSSMVLTSYWRYLNDKPIELEKQGACYRRWWEEQKRLIEDAPQKGLGSHPVPEFACP